MTTMAEPGTTKGFAGPAGWLALALALTLLNAACPPTVDDPAYLRQATAWAAHPLQPLGGESLLYQTMVPAARTASAPVAIAWLALGVRVCGDSPWVLKLWLLPFAALLACAASTLLRRAAPSLSAWYAALFVLSPAILPSFHFMLDVPALALALAALAVFTREPEPRPLRAAILAGLLAGFALQSKYTALPMLAALLAHGVLAGRARAALLATAVALAVFTGLEAALFASAGTSPLVEYLRGRGARDPGGHRPLVTAKRLVIMAGGVAPALIPLGLTALRAPRRMVHASLVAVLAGFALLALAPARLVAGLDGASGGRWINTNNVSIGWMGVALGLLAIVVAWRARREDAFVRAMLAWLAAECALAPFVSASASARRLLGALAALTLVMARLVERAVTHEPARRADVIAIAIAGVALGVGFWGVNLDSALAERRVLAAVSARAGGSAGVAYVGDHWGGFQDAASRAGLTCVTADREPLRRGDWLALPFDVEMRGVALDESRVALVDSVPFPHALPVTTRRSYYDGRQPLRRVDPAWVGAHLYRVTADGLVLHARR